MGHNKIMRVRDIILAAVGATILWAAAAYGEIDGPDSGEVGEPLKYSAGGLSTWALAPHAADLDVSIAAFPRQWAILVSQAPGTITLICATAPNGQPVIEMKTITISGSPAAGTGDPLVDLLVSRLSSLAPSDRADTCRSVAEAYRQFAADVKNGNVVANEIAGQHRARIHPLLQGEWELLRRELGQQLIAIEAEADWTIDDYPRVWVKLATVFERLSGD